MSVLVPSSSEKSSLLMPVFVSVSATPYLFLHPFVSVVFPATALPPCFGPVSGLCLQPPVSPPPPSPCLPASSARSLTESRLCRRPPAEKPCTPGFSSAPRCLLPRSPAASPCSATCGGGHRRPAQALLSCLESRTPSDEGSQSSTNRHSLRQEDGSHLVCFIPGSCHRPSCIKCIYPLSLIPGFFLTPPSPPTS